MNSKRSSLLVTGLIVTAILLVLNWLVGVAGLMNFRFDLTEKKLYTLSEGTEHILSAIKPDEPVTIRFYATQGRLMPPAYTKYASTVEDLLLEYEKASDGKVKVDRIDPRPDTEEEDKARADDVAGHVVDENGDKAYFGIAVQCRDHKEVLPNLDPSQETALEYDLSRAIAKVTRVKKSVVGVMSAMPIAGPAMNFPMMRQQQPQPWAVVEQLRQDYEVKDVPVTTDKIDADIGILVIIHPADIQEKTEFAIDQFVLRGGKVVAFVDPQCAVSTIYNNQQNPMMGMAPPTVPPSSDMKTLFKAWGVGYDSQMVVADMSDGTPFQQRRVLPTFLTIGTKDNGINQSVPATAQLEAIQMFSPGAFTVEKKDGINAVTLLQSSENTMMVDPTTAEKARRTPMDSFRSEGRRRILGLQLTGHFKTAFPDGAPKQTAPTGPALPNGPHPGFPGGTGGSETDAGAPAKKDEKPPTTPPAAAAPQAPKAPEPKPAEAAKAPAKPAETAPAKPVVTPPVQAPAPAEKPATVAAPPAAPAKPAEPPALKESTNNEGAIFIFSDADMLYDGFCFQQDQLGQMHLINHNMIMLLNIVETLNGGADLISVRSRGSTKREFSKFKELINAVSAKYRPRIEELTQQIDKAQRDVGEIKANLDKSGNVRLIVSPEQAEKLKEANEKSVSLAKELRETRKAETKDKDLRETWITVLNILTVPLFVIIFGVVLAMRRHALEAAK